MGMITITFTRVVKGWIDIGLRSFEKLLYFKMFGNKTCILYRIHWNSAGKSIKLKLIFARNTQCTLKIFEELSLLNSILWSQKLSEDRWITVLLFSFQYSIVSDKYSALCAIFYSFV